MGQGRNETTLKYDIGCDYCALPDYPNRDKWLVYRQELRDFQENCTIDTPFP